MWAGPACPRLSHTAAPPPPPMSLTPVTALRATWEPGVRPTHPDPHFSPAQSSVLGKGTPPGPSRPGDCHPRTPQRGGSSQTSTPAQVPRGSELGAERRTLTREVLDK